MIPAVKNYFSSYFCEEKNKEQNNCKALPEKIILKIFFETIGELEVDLKTFVNLLQVSKQFQEALKQPDFYFSPLVAYQ